MTGLERGQPLLRRWGLLGGWRVRFTSAQGSVLVGLAPGGELVALELEGPVEFHPQSADRNEDLPVRLNGASVGVWNGARAVGTGASETADGSEEQISWFVEEQEQLLRLTTTVKTIEGAVTRVTCNHELLGTDAARAARADAIETVAGLGGMLSAVGAAGAGTRGESGHRARARTGRDCGPCGPAVPRTARSQSCASTLATPT
ncbi:MAG: hypothetical protein M3376_01780 [Actinomycetota bacterium]|nr:hypothetical protein [Actinomycetota bacterium]